MILCHYNLPQFYIFFKIIHHYVNNFKTQLNTRKYCNYHNRNVLLFPEVNIINIRLIHEYNSDGHLLYIENFPGAYVRSPSKEDAFSKLTTEIKNYCLWADIPCDLTDISYTIVQEKLSTLQICDADSDVIFESEKKPPQSA